MLALSSAALSFSAPLAAPLTAQRASVSMAVDVNSMSGKYSVKGIVYDPLNLASKFDVNWLREAEIK
jgi:hypothetical protein